MKKTILAIAMFCVSVMLLLALNTAQRRTAAAELALTEGTVAAVSQAAADMEKMIIALEKLQMTSSLRQAGALLSQINLLADRIQQSLADLPDAQGQRSAILSYLSALSEQAQHGIADLAEGSFFTAESRSVITGMTGNLQLLLSELTLAQGDLLSGQTIAALPPTDLTEPPTAQELTTYKALPSHEISNGEALQIAREFVGADRVLSVAPAPDTTGALPAFGVTLQTPDVQLNAEVTRRGGKILLMAPETASFAMVKSPQECAAAALSFLKSRGFAEMEAPYYQVYDGLCVLTCVYVHNGVLIWPDRVLVQVRMDTAEVVGLEARSYWRNHIPRRLQSPLLTKSEASASLSAEAAVTAARLCLIPHQGQERLCWQFTLTNEDDTYIACIDAMTGSELLLEKLMQLEYGQIPV